MKKKKLEIAIHLVFWCILGYYFVQRSQFRFTTFSYPHEIATFIVSIALVYTCTLFCYPKYGREKHYTAFFATYFSTLFLFSAIEFFIIYPKIHAFIARTPESEHFSYYRWNIIGILSRNFILSALFTLAIAYRDTVRRLKSSDKNAAKLKAEISAIRDHMNFHMFFNHMNNLYSIASMNNDKCSSHIGHLSDTMRYMFQYSQQETVSLADEIRCMQSLIELEKLKVYNTEINFKVDCISSPENILIPPLLFETFINNAFKYCGQEAGDFISIQMQADEKQLNFICKNSIGQKNAAVISTKNGIKSITERLRLLFPNTHHLELVPSEEMYMVKLQLKLNAV